MISVSDVVAAHTRIRPYLQSTPLCHSPGLSGLLGRPVYLKLENLQQTGSFKLRGALNFILTLPVAERHRGLVTASAGNYGQGVALAARLLGVPATVYVPESTPRVKLQAIRALGAELCTVPGGYGAAHEQALAAARSGPAAFVPAFEHEMVMAGQGTVALEVLAELAEVAAFVVPVGGGGLAAGVGVVARGLTPGARLLGVQSELTPAMYRSLQAGRVVSVPEPPTLCEGLAGDIAPLSFEYGRRVLDGMALVPEQAVERAVAWMVQEHRLVTEGSGAVGVAAVLDRRVQAELFRPGETGPVVIVISGGNIDARVLSRILSTHTQEEGRWWKP